MYEQSTLKADPRMIALAIGNEFFHPSTGFTEEQSSAHASNKDCSIIQDDRYLRMYGVILYRVRCVHTYILTYLQ